MKKVLFSFAVAAVAAVMAAGVEKYGDGKCTIDGREFKMVSMAHQVYLISDLKEGGSLMFKMAEYGYEKFPLCKELLNSIKFK